MTDVVSLSYPSLSVDTRRPEAVRAARRHSRLVRGLRVAVPALALALGAGFFGFAMLWRPVAPVTQEAIQDLGVSGASIRMERPKLTGYNSERRAYEVTADRAEQSIKSPEEIGLVRLEARVQMRDNGFAKMTAATGRYDSKAQTLQLDRDVRIDTDLGDQARLANADVDLKAGRISSDKPVDIKVGNAKLTADSMKILDNGNRMEFKGRVVLYMKRDAKAGDAGAARGTSPSTGARP